MIVLPAFAFALVLIYLVITGHYQKHWMEDFDVTLRFSEEQAVWETACFCTRRLSTKRK